MKQVGTTFVLASGYEFEANGGIIGIDHAGGVFEGYDGRIVEGDREDPDLPGRRLWTEAERREVAAFMIRRWTEWAF